MVRKPGFHVGLGLMLLLAIITACSGGSNPIAGSLPGGDEGLRTPRTAAVSSPRMLWGYWNCVVDLQTGTVQVVPVRGAMMHVNAVEWMQPPGGKLANLLVNIVDQSEWLTEGRLDVDIGLTHPFQGLDQFTGFDVMGVFMTDAHTTLKSQVAVRMSDGGVTDATMLNADGYTRWWNQDEFDVGGIRIFTYIPGKLGIKPEGLNATINPYKYFCKDIGLTDEEGQWLADHPDDRGMFPAGATVHRLYQLKWPMVGGSPQLAYDYAVVASWEPADVIPPTAVPDDFPITANALEPVALSVANYSDLYYDESSDTYGGSVIMDLEAFDWQGLIPGQSIPDTIQRLAVEFLPSPSFPTGDYRAFDSSTWTVAPGKVNSSIWSVDLAGLEPEAAGETELLILFETIYDYDNGYGTGYPVGAALTSYFPTLIDVYSKPGMPFCENPVTEWTERTYIEIEPFTADVGAPGAAEYHIDWAVDPTGDPKDWVNTDTDSIFVNWYEATGQGGNIIDPYEVCVSVYSTEGFAMCCTEVMVSDLPNLEPVTGQNGVTPPQQPNQGAQPPDITVWDTGSSSYGELMFQDSVLSQVRIYRFDDNYGSSVGVATLDNTYSPPYPPPLDDPTSWNDFHKFDVQPTGVGILLSSANAAWPSLTTPNTWNVNINDPFHSYLLPYFNMSGLNKMLGFYGDVGMGGNPDPDSVAWKHVVDWTSGAAHFDTRIYGLQTVSELWIPVHPGYTHPGDIYAIYSKSPYDDITDDYDVVAVGLSSQDPGGGPVNDVTPNLMALGVDDAMPVQVDWSSSPDYLGSNIVVWYMLSSEASAAARKVHIVWLPEDIDTGFDLFYYDDYIGTGSPWGVDFGGFTPVDLEVMYSARTGSGLDHSRDWLAVLLDTGVGWRVDVLRYDPLFGSIVLVDYFSDIGVIGDPTALDVDTVQHEIHVLYDVGGVNGYRVTVLHFTP